MNEKTVIWRVRVGKLYYVQGLHRYIKESLQKHKNLEMSSYKEAAFLFYSEKVSKDLAHAIAGVSEKVELAVGEYSRLTEIHEYHTESQSDWERYSNETIPNKTKLFSRTENDNGL